MPVAIVLSPDQRVCSRVGTALALHNCTVLFRPDGDGGLTPVYQQYLTRQIELDLFVDLIQPKVLRSAADLIGLAGTSDQAVKETVIKAKLRRTRVHCEPNGVLADSSFVALLTRLPKAQAEMFIACNPEVFFVIVVSQPGSVPALEQLLTCLRLRDRYPKRFVVALETDVAHAQLLKEYAHLAQLPHDPDFDDSFRQFLQLTTPPPHPASLLPTDAKLELALQQAMQRESAFIFSLLRRLSSYSSSLSDIKADASKSDSSPDSSPPSSSMSSSTR